MANQERDPYTRFSPHPQKREIAYHAAGHAVVSMRLGGSVTRIELCDADDDNPDRWVLIRGNGFEEGEYLEKATSSLIGPIVECLASNGENHPRDVEPLERICQFLFEHQEAAGITEDLQDAWMELSVVCDLDLLDDRQLGERLAAWQWLTIRTYRIAVENWEDIEGVTEELLAHGIVSYQRLKEIVPS